MPSTNFPHSPPQFSSLSDRLKQLRSPWDHQHNVNNNNNNNKHKYNDGNDIEDNDDGARPFISSQKIKKVEPPFKRAKLATSIVPPSLPSSSFSSSSDSQASVCHFYLYIILFIFIYND